MRGMETAAHRIIDRLGGINRVARLLGHRNSSTVQGWKMRGVIPTRRIPELIRVARSVGVEITAADCVDVPEPPSAAEAA